MKIIALSLVIALSSLSCRGPEAVELTPQEKRFEAFQSALEWDIDRSKVDLEQARVAMDARDPDDLQFNARWQSVRRQLEAVELDLGQRNSMEKAELEKMIRDLARLRNDASEIRVEATAPQK